jgi:O-acetylhomoserine (thiol)-lyase
VAKIGRPLGIPVIVDNTAAPVPARPFDHGAAIVLHLLTKYIGGRGNSICGIIVDGGSFEWEAHPDRQPLLNRPDPSYHGAAWTQATKPLGPAAYIVKARVTLLRDIGARCRRTTPSWRCRAWRLCHCGSASTAATPPRSRTG